MKHKWIETHGLCVKYILYIKGKTQMLRAIMAKPCCPNGYEKDKNWEKNILPWRNSNQVEMDQKTALCVIYTLYIKGLPQIPRARANSCCPQKRKKGHKNDTNFYIALEELKSSRNGPKHWSVCDIHYTSKDFPKCPGQGQIHIDAKRTRKGHKKDANFYIALEGFNQAKMG